MSQGPSNTVRAPSPVIYLALGVHRRGGMERAAIEVIERLRHRRPVVVVARECELSGVRHVRVNAPRRPTVLEVTAYRWAARRALRRLRAESPNGITTGIGASGGPVDVVVAQYCQEAFRQRIGAIRASGRLQVWWHRQSMARFCADERAVYQSPTLKRVIAVSRGVGRELVDYYGVDERIIRYVPNGVDLSVFGPAAGDEKRTLRASLGIPADGLLAAFVGGDWRRKGLRTAIESLRDAHGVRLVVAGAGDVARFTGYAVTAGVADRVHFIGRRSDPQIVMRAADVYVFPSAYEAFSLSCIEAAACGLPLIVTRINGVEELVTDGENGLFVRRDAADVAAALRRLDGDTILRQRLATRAAEVARQYDWDVVAAGHERVYEEVDAERI